MRLKTLFQFPGVLIFLMEKEIVRHIVIVTGTPSEISLSILVWLTHNSCTVCLCLSSVVLMKSV